jgi:hypothetical protein
LITPSHFVHLEVWIWTNSMLWNACSTSKSKTNFFGEDWLKCFATEILDAKYKKTDVTEVMKRLTHLDAHQKQTCFECYRKTKRCLMKFLMFIHMKRLSKKTTEYTGSASHVNWTKSKDESNIRCWWSRTFCAHVLGTSFSLNLTWVCNNIHLSLTTKVKTPVPSSHHLVNTSTWDSWWDSNALQTLLKQ